MIRYSVLAFPVLAACGSSATLSAPEARHTFESLNRVTTGVVLQSLDSVLNGGSSSLVFDTNSGTNYTLTGTLDETAWSGDINVDGSVDTSGGKLGYSLALNFDQVQMDGGAILDGDVGFDFTADDTIDLAKLKYTAGVGVLGALDVSGADRGRADMQYDVSLEMNGPAVSIDGTGDISGHDISSWGEVVSLLF